MRQRTQIAIDRQRLTFIRTTSGSHLANCEQCGGESTVLSPLKVAQALGVEITEVCRLVAFADLHLTNTKRGPALICGTSLQNKKLVKGE